MARALSALSAAIGLAGMPENCSRLTDGIRQSLFVRVIEQLNHIKAQQSAIGGDNPVQVNPRPPQ